MLTLEGVTVARSALANAMTASARDAWRVVPVAPFAAFFEDREPEATGGRRPPTPARHRSQIPPAGEKLPEVFISYAWGDDTRKDVPDGGGRASLRGVEDGWLPTRPGPRSAAGGPDLTLHEASFSADLVVAVISDKYLRSPYCMYEIYRIQQQCEAEAERLARRVVPIVLPDVRLATFEERAPYLRLWSRREKTLGKLIRDPELHPSEASWTEYRLVHYFAHHVDSIPALIEDVLMPGGSRLSSIMASKP